jgi:hypothetical protein
MTVCTATRVGMFLQQSGVACGVLKRRRIWFMETSISCFLSWWRVHKREVLQHFYWRNSSGMTWQGINYQDMLGCYHRKLYNPGQTCPLQVHGAKYQ